jgi:hypothetical protein
MNYRNIAAASLAAFVCAVLAPWSVHAAYPEKAIRVITLAERTRLPMLSQVLHHQRIAAGLCGFVLVRPGCAGWLA